MRIERMPVEKIVIHGAPRLDPITVILEDLGHSQGQITLSCYGKSWTAYFGNHGSQGIAHAVGESFSTDYLVDRFLSNAGIESSLPSMDRAKASVLNELLEQRRQHRLSHEEAREEFDRINDEWPETIEEGWHDRSGVLQRWLGSEWWYAIPNAPTPDYQYLTRIVDAVKAALASMQEPAKEAA